jgi:hypothetical protein
MRPTIATRIIVPVVAAFALVAVPLAAHAAAPERTTTITATPPENVAVNGLYSLVVKGSGKAEQRVDLMLVKDENGYTGRLITADQEVALESIDVDGNVIHARVITNFGRAKVTLTVEKDAVRGTLVLAKATLLLSGDRVY